MNERVHDNQGSLHEQEEALLTYLEHHSGLASNKFLGINGVQTRNEQWARLALILNSIGPKKSVKSWIRYWTDLKRKSRVYNAEKNKVFRKTGNDTEQVFHCNEKYERIIQILGTSHKNGLPLIPEIGVNQSSIQKQKLDTFNSTSGGFNERIAIKLHTSPVTSPVFNLMSNQLSLDMSMSAPQKSSVSCSALANNSCIPAMNPAVTGRTVFADVSSINPSDNKILKKNECTSSPANVTPKKRLNKETFSASFVVLAMEESNELLFGIKEAISELCDCFKVKLSADADFQVQVLSHLENVSHNVKMFGQ